MQLPLFIMWAPTWVLDASSDVIIGHTLSFGQVTSELLIYSEYIEIQTVSPLAFILLEFLLIKLSSAGCLRGSKGPQS